jgi:NTP pyrophosphatase (non-canonical NTP hydrolase)
MIMEDRVNIIELKKMFPDITTRPDVISDLALDLTGQSQFVRSFSDLSKKAVASLATWLPSKLSYNPYYTAQYELKLQSMIAVASSQGRILKLSDKAQFESVARDYAMNQFRAKINAFNRDMNYHGLVDYLFAFFPAVVEQYRAYGRITMERPEFPLQVFQMSQIPSRLGEVQEDQYGNKYTEVVLPILGINARLSTDWWNAINPTGGTVLSASPFATAAYNEISKSKKLPTRIHDLILPFGTQANSAGALTPSTIRRGVQAIQASILRNGEQFNRDIDMFMAMKRKDFKDTYGVEPSGTDMSLIQEESNELLEAIQTYNCVEIIDAISDILYVVYGAADSFESDFDEAINLESNHQPVENKLKFGFTISLEKMRIYSKESTCPYYIYFKSLQLDKPIKNQINRN